MKNILIVVLFYVIPFIIEKLRKSKNPPSNEKLEKDSKKVKPAVLVSRKEKKDTVEKRPSDVARQEYKKLLEHPVTKPENLVAEYQTVQIKESKTERDSIETNKKNYEILPNNRQKIDDYTLKNLFTPQNMLEGIILHEILSPPKGIKNRQ